MTDETESVPLYECEYCGETHTLRGLEGHIRLTAGGGHGPRGETPDDFNLFATETGA